MSRHPASRHYFWLTPAPLRMFIPSCWLPIVTFDFFVFNTILHPVSQTEQTPLPLIIIIPHPAIKICHPAFIFTLVPNPAMLQNSGITTSFIFHPTFLQCSRHLVACSLTDQILVQPTNRSLARTEKKIQRARSRRIMLRSSSTRACRSVRVHREHVCVLSMVNPLLFAD